ncbi:MAG TPA: tetratricopeptide repeat protein, partial [Chthoniobacteraceae bacterium]|nr:tetratricopeptide repeat protein [Chthoniobacteraceae bacterium]
FEEARDQFRDAIRDNPWNWVAYNDLAVVCGKLGQLSDSRRALERSVWINPRYEEGRRNLDFLRQRFPGMPGWR